MNDDLRAFLETVNSGMMYSDVILHETDYVDNNVELSDDQVKQIFMILAQAAVFRRVQGSLKGYKPLLPIDRLEQKLDEANPMNVLNRISDAFRKRFGDKGRKMAAVAANTSKEILRKWDDESIAGGISPTIENMVTWLKNKGVDRELINIAFTSIGVPNVDRVIGPEPEPEPEPENSAVAQWLDDEMLQPGGFTGALAKEFLLDKGVPSDRADKMLARIGIQTGRIVSKANYDKLNLIVDKFGGQQTRSTSSNEKSSGDAPTAEWPASKVFQYVQNNYDVNEEKLRKAFDYLGTSAESTDAIGSDALSNLTAALSGHEKQKNDNVIDKTQDIMSSIGGTVSGAVSAGKKAAADGDYSGMSELQKLGIAILSARKKI